MNKEKASDELIIANKEIAFQNNEKDKRAAELIIANNELAFQNKEKENRAAELIIANNELAFQNKEKEKRATELMIANNELVFQNDEKEKRAAELVIANKELLFQNEQKEKRAAELVIANKELLFQNEEKEKRAAELVIAKELLFQNEDKEKRAAELIIANKELVIQNEEKRKQAAELEEANKELESFSYSVSHDLRAPLRAINGFTQVLAEDYLEQLNDEAKAILNEIIANSNKMGELIDNLLEFSRIGKQHVSRVDVNIKQLVDTVISELKQLEPKRIFNIIVNNLYNINGDRNMLKQVFINLLSNAFKYTGNKEEALIELGSYPENDQCIYYVKDNGAGFDMRYYDKLFGVFQRLHSSNEFDGTGVGLAIIQKIIIKHQGKVWAEGKVGEGACFYISLPTT
ncbi:MAG TPA: ATP-binding protein [Chitinophagaceae bacterium]|nr:ATP-binding protein [Chitinophagaceae bacterium]